MAAAGVGSGLGSGVAELVPLTALVARPLAAVLVLVWGSGVVPPLAGLAVAAAVALFTAPLALAAASHSIGLGDGVAGAALALSAWGSLSSLTPSAVIGEGLRGAMLGLAALAPLWAARTAGLWAGQRFRLGAASSASPVAALYAAMLGVAFVAVDGPMLVCAAIARSYQSAPLAAEWGIGSIAGGLELSSALLGIGAWITTAMRLCLPLLLALAVAELAVAAATRAGAAAAIAWPGAVLAPALALLVTAPMIPLLVGALAIAVRRGLSP